MKGAKPWLPARYNLLAMILRQLFDSETSTFTYLVADEETRQAALIDSVFEHHLRDLALVRELDLDLRLTLETHVHADHVSGAWLMQRALGSEIALSGSAGSQGADRLLAHGDVLKLGTISIEVRATPGHTDGCLSYVLPEHAMVFTGDALLIRGAGRTDFQQGSAKSLFRSVREQIFTLPDHALVYPGHDYSGRSVTTVAEERAHNPRLADGVREEDFVAYMDNLGLPHPAKMDRAVPANLQCGRPDDPDLAPHAPDWGPVIRTFAGVWQIEAEWVHRHAGEVCLIDVRELVEVDGSPMGRIPGSIVIPLPQLRGRTDEVGRDRPVVCVCPAGARSAVAAGVLEKAGFEQVANLRGGILAWRAAGLPVETS
jgi:glyoxylase-like metal-dependent hydrolase (beta-lactamase superfamily II)/rhodanese-related sulfurtransferase